MKRWLISFMFVVYSKEKEKLEAGKLSPKDMFASQKDKYSQFDQQVSAQYPLGV